MTGYELDLERLVRQLGTKFLEIIREKDLGTNMMNIQRILNIPDGCGESKVNGILGTVLNKLHDEWFKGTDEDDDDLEGIIDYLEPTLYDGFVNVTRYSIGPGEVYTKIKVSGVEELSRTRGNIATIRAGIMDAIFRNDDNEESYDET
ncbi:hypothetical protein Tco_0698431 [Tanacetum coccineum]